MWGKQKIKKKIGKILRIRANNFGASGNNITKLVHVMCHKTGMKIWVLIFWGPAPLKFAGAQLGSILDSFILQSQISPEWIEISTVGKRRYQLQSVRRSMKKI